MEPHELQYREGRAKMIKVGSSVMVSNNSGAFTGRNGVVVRISDNSLFPYVVCIEGLNMRMLFSEDELIEIQD